jgi:hypothetical protein
LLWLEQTEVTFNQVISLNGKPPLPNYRLEIIYQHQDKNSKAIGSLKQTFLLSSKLRQVHQFPGKSYNEIGQSAFLQTVSGKNLRQKE